MQHGEILLSYKIQINAREWKYNIRSILQVILVENSPIYRPVALKSRTLGNNSQLFCVTIDAFRRCDRNMEDS